VVSKVDVGVEDMRAFSKSPQLVRISFLRCKHRRSKLIILG
jgi:hypothetical protein